MFVLTWEAFAFLYSDICSRYMALVKALNGVSPLMSPAARSGGLTYS